MNMGLLGVASMNFVAADSSGFSNPSQSLSIYLDPHGPYKLAWALKDMGVRLKVKIN